MSGPAAGPIAELRARIASFDTAKRESSARMISLGAASIEDALPMGGLRRDALHEVAAATYGDMAATMGFATALVACFAEASPMAPVLWCEGNHAPFDVGGLYGPGLAAFGLDPARLVLVTPPRDVELLW
ncbi:MAG: inducible mutagenesis protein A, partial [Parvibaculum sedimenti]